MSVQIRVMTPDDVPAGIRLTEIAGWNQTPADWHRFLAGTSGGCFVAEYLGRVIGTSATIVYGGTLAWVSMELVDPRFRGQGVGTALLERAVEHLDALGIPTMKLDATPLGRPIYERAGFVGEYDVERWELHRKAARPAAPQGSPPALDDVLRLDRDVFGADRSRLLQSLAGAAPEFTLEARRKGEMVGYALGRRGALADHLGPWVACDQETAAALLDTFLARSGRETIFVDCLPGNPWVVQLLDSRGFELSRPLIRMYRGANLVSGRPECVAGIVGPEFG